MTQKHFIAIASIIKRQYQADGRGTSRMAIRTTATDLADYFASINPNFKRDKFLAACGLGD